jgi:hypothetical protein
MGMKHKFSSNQNFGIELADPAPNHGTDTEACLIF